MNFPTKRNLEFNLRMSTEAINLIPQVTRQAFEKMK